MDYNLNVKKTIVIISISLAFILTALANETLKSNNVDDGLTWSRKNQELLLGKVKLLHLGMSYSEVTSILGEPDNSCKLKGKRPSDPVKGLVLTYYFERESENTVNEKLDKLLSIVLSSENRVVSMKLKNIVFSEYEQ